MDNNKILKQAGVQVVKERQDGGGYEPGRQRIKWSKHEIEHREIEDVGDIGGAAKQIGNTRGK